MHSHPPTRSSADIFYVSAVFRACVLLAPYCSGCFTMGQFSAAAGGESTELRS